MSSTESSPAPTRRGVQSVVRVVATEQLTPHLVRVRFGGPGAADLLRNADPEKLASAIMRLYAGRNQMEPPEPVAIQARSTLPNGNGNGHTNSKNGTTGNAGGDSTAPGASRQTPDPVD